MIKQFLELPPFTFITIIVQAQLVIAFAMSGVIAIMLVRRNHRNTWIEGARTAYADLLVNEMLQALEGGPVEYQLSIPTWPTERAVLKQVLLEHLKSVSGSERQFLLKRYEDLGFVKTDLAALNSFFWWRRLQAASDLASLESIRFAKEFHRMAADPHELVSAFALYALSALDHDLNRPFPVGSFPVSVSARGNLMAEILRNWARIRGPRVITEQIPRVRDPRQLEALVNAASSMLTPETGDAFALLLGRDAFYSVEVTDRMLVTLKKIGDPQHSDVVRRYLNHANEILRLRALEYLVEMGEDDVLSLPEVRRDRSVSVRRAVERWRFEREDAA